MIAIGLALAPASAGCASNAETVPDDGPRDPASDAAPTSAPPTSAPPTSAKTPTPTPKTSAPPPVASGNGSPEDFCLQRYVCACNLGCAKIRVAKSDLVAGAKVKMLSGPETGKDAFLEEVTGKSGRKALVLGNTDPTVGPLPCMNARDASLLAFPCSTDKSGPADTDACLGACGP